MRIGYPCINLTIECRGNRTFRLKSYSEERLIGTVRNNLDCLLAILQYNVEHHILFFRITSDLIPFASHPVCDFGWPSYFEKDLRAIGNYIISNNIRISMHPGQYTILNSPNDGVLEASIKTELEDRQQVCTIIGSFEGIEVYSGEEKLPEGAKATTQAELRGRVACGGKAVGRAKLISRPEEMYKVNHGDVIVTQMTAPSITPAIRRCVAIVTDEGGITSHAAVISREFNIPCIIATKNATDVIKDKDLVEVDGDMGIVRVLN